jgi:hypothetical protein
MSTSDGLACLVCGELPDITKFGWGCVFCNPERAAAASKPEVPVNPGDRLGCLQHGEIDCKRCGILETRHRLAIDEHVETPAGSWVRDTRGGGLGVAILFLLLMLLVFGCGFIVWDHWPR